MKVNGIKSQNFGLNPSNEVRRCIVKAGLEGVDIRPLRKIIGELYPYRYMEMLGDYNKVQGVNITDVCGAHPRITKVLSPKWQNKYNQHKHPVYGDRWRDHYVDQEGEKIWAKHAFDDVVGGIVVYKDLKGKKSFKDIIKVLTSKLEEIRAKQDPLSKAMDEFNAGLPEYGQRLSPRAVEAIRSSMSDQRIY